MIEFKIAVLYMTMRSESIHPVAYLGKRSIGPCPSGHTNPFWSKGTMICPPLCENISVQRKNAPPLRNPKYVTGFIV
jgi:hypothetical protein